MFTANSMNCLAEALGLALPGNGSILAGTKEREELARQAARQIMALVEADLKPRDIVTREALDNAFILDMAMGGSTNTVLHTIAVAHEAGVEYPLSRLNELSERVPHLCKVSPAGQWHMEDVHRAGGISAILKELSRIDGLLHLDAKTVTLKTLGENIADAEIKDEEVIRPLERAHSRSGGLSILFGNLAPDGAVIKTGAVDPSIRVFRGPAVVFDSQDSAIAAIALGKVKAGRCGGDPLRRAQRRAGDAGNALADLRHRRNGTGQRGGADHGRPLLRGDAGDLHRPRVSGGGGGGTDRPRFSRGT